MTKTCSNVGTRARICCFLTLLGVFPSLFWDYNILDRGQTQIIGITVSQLCAGSISLTPYCSASDWNSIKAAFAGSRLWNRQAPSITSWWRRLQGDTWSICIFHCQQSSVLTVCTGLLLHSKMWWWSGYQLLWCPLLGGQRSGSSPSMKVVHI